MREVRFVGASLKELAGFREESKREAGFALEGARRGQKHPSAKPLKGFGGASVLEVVCDDDGDAYRVVYTMRIKDAVYVRCAFQKKSNKGKETPKRHIDKIRSRLALAELDAVERTKG